MLLLINLMWIGLCGVGGVFVVLGVSLLLVVYRWLKFVCRFGWVVCSWVSVLVVFRFVGMCSMILCNLSLG